MAGKLKGKRIACLATNGFEWAELTEPKKALEREGAQVDVISLEKGKIRGEQKGKDAGGVDGKRMTSWPSLEADLKNAGAHWSDEEVIVDGNLVTSRKPDDIPAFDREAIEVFASA